MTREEVLARIEEAGIIPAVRVASAADAIFASEAVFSGGIPIVEIPVTVPDAIGVISGLARAHADLIIGAGSILDLDTARACLDAGASFLTTTGLDPEIVSFASRHGMSIIPGALTPSEVMLAKRAGADFIKIFPCFSMGGPAYVRCLKAPFPNIRMIASGGVTQQNAADYIRAGAIVLGIGEDLLPRDAISGRNPDWIRELARRFKQMVKEARHREKTS
jgi:2-dehydro-3-deoxyphosphogluconate aldolase/(4S)-4-hydroxy-2-oxoglutarate aldolase